MGFLYATEIKWK